MLVRTPNTAKLFADPRRGYAYMALGVMMNVFAAYLAVRLIAPAVVPNAIDGFLSEGRLSWLTPLVVFASAGAMILSRNMVFRHGEFAYALSMSGLAVMGYLALSYMMDSSFTAILGESGISWINLILIAAGGWILIYAGRHVVDGNY